MGKAKTPSFILTLDLKPEIYQIHILEKRFNIARQLYNACLGELLKRQQKMKSDVRYIHNHQETNATIRKQVFQSLNQEYGLTEYDLHVFVKPMYQHFSIHIDSNTGQKIATRAWKTFEKHRFGHAKKVRFKKIGEMNSVEGKDHRSGILFRDGFLVWSGLNLKVHIDKNDTFAEMSLQQRIKFCRIQRRLIRGKVKFYLQLIIEGFPPPKIDPKTGSFKRTPVSGEVGLDIGISTLAVVSDEQVKMVELAYGLEDTQRMKRRLQRKLDRSRRATNPNKYNSDGTINKSDRNKWIHSKRYIKILLQYKEIERKLADKRKLSHEKTANLVVSMGDVVKVEKMNYRALQKGRYGKRIGLKAPSLLFAILNRKLGYIHRSLFEVNTWKVRASQYDPFKDTYEKKSLSNRWHDLENGVRIQRDLFSAWLIKHVKEDLCTIDRERCIREFDSFYVNYKEEEARLRGMEGKLLSSIGI